MEVVRISAQIPLLHITAAVGLDTECRQMAGDVMVSGLHSIHDFSSMCTIVYFLQILMNVAQTMVAVHRYVPTHRDHENVAAVLGLC